MKFKETKLKDLYIIKLEPFQDNRGFFSRVFCKNELKEIGLNKEIVQINQSLTKTKGTIRGMHFQYPPRTEVKIIKCVRGLIFDVAVDIRKNSPSFLQWHSEILSNENFKMLYIPEGFAHGFQALENNSEIIYFNSEFYSPECEGGIRYNDPKIKINWPMEPSEISKKDYNFKLIDESFKPIVL